MIFTYEETLEMANGFDALISFVSKNYDQGSMYQNGDFVSHIYNKDKLRVIEWNESSKVNLFYFEDENKQKFAWKIIRSEDEDGVKYDCYNITEYEFLNFVKETLDKDERRPYNTPHEVVLFVKENTTYAANSIRMKIETFERFLSRKTNQKSQNP